MDRKAEFIKANKQLLGKGLDYIALDRKYIEWLEQKLASAEAENASHNNNYAVQQASPKFPTFETCRETVNNILPLNDIEENVGCLFYQTIQKLGNFA